MNQLLQRVCTYLLVVACLLWSGSVAASKNPVLDDKLTFKLGVIRNQLDGDLTIARKPLPVTSVDIEDVLNIDTTENSPWFAFRWRFTERWAVNFHFNRFDQSGGAEVSEEFNLDGVVYPVGARIDTDFLADAYIMDLSYNLFQGNQYEAGVGFGLHAFNLKVNAKGSVLAGDTYEEYATSSQPLIAPVPNLRIYATYAFGSKTSITFNGGWLSLSYEDYDGNFYYTEIHVEYRFTESWGIGGGTQYTDMNLEHDSGSGDFEKLNVNFTGIQGYITYSF